LFQQLSDPNVTLNEIENFCATNRDLRELCRTDPWFIQLKEGKRVFVRIEKDRVSDLRDDYIIHIFNYRGINVIVNSFTLSSIKGDASLKDVLNILNAKSFIVIGSILIEFDDMTAFYQTDREGRREGITRPTPGKYVKISFYGLWWRAGTRNLSFSLPYSLLKSILYEAGRLDEENLYGIINILVNGDVIYDKLETITPDPKRWPQSRYHASIVL